MAANALPIMVFDNILEDGTVTVSSEASGFDKEFAWSDYLFQWWKATASGTQYIDVDAGGAVSADALGMAQHNLLASAADVRLLGSATGAFAGEETVVLSAFTPTEDKAFIKTFVSASFRYWRIEIVTAAVTPFVGFVKLGEKFEFERYLVDGFDPEPDNVRASAATSEGGIFLGAVTEATVLNLVASWQHLTDSWVEDTFRVTAWEGFLKTLRPCFWAWDITNHATQVFVIRFKPQTVLSMPYNQSRRNMVIPMEAMQDV